MRVALCLSGQMRTYEQCYENLKRYIIAPFQPDIFIHTWKNTGVTHHIKDLIPKSQLNINYYVIEKDVTYENLNNLYFPKLSVIEDFKNIYTEELNDIRVPDILKEKEPKHYKGSLPMFYKMKKCNDLKCEWENSNKFKYDAVIRLRPDLMIEQCIPKEVFNQLNLLWHSDYAIDPLCQVSDKFAISNSEIMNYYNSVWDNIHEYWQNPLGDGSWKNYRVGERLMKFHIDNAPFSSKLFSIACCIKREKPIPEGFAGKVYELLFKMKKKINLRKRLRL